MRIQEIKYEVLHLGFKGYGGFVLRSLEKYGGCDSQEMMQYPAICFRHDFKQKQIWWIFLVFLR